MSETGSAPRPTRSANLSGSMRIENLTRGTVLASRAALADNLWTRMKGLLGRASLEAGEGLVIRPCKGVHTLMMAFPIDVLHVDRDGTVLRIVPSMPPNRLGPTIWRSRFVVELPAGAAAAAATLEGDLIQLSPAR